MANLYMMMGLPGSGKTTFAHTYFKNQLGPPPVYISRDEIRFGILEKYNIDTEDEYFAHEVEVYEKFCNQIILYLKKGYDVIADATHLNNASRWKLINRISDYYDKWIVIFLNTNVESALKTIEKEQGSRACLKKLFIICIVIWSILHLIKVCLGAALAKFGL